MTYQFDDPTRAITLAEPVPSLHDQLEQAEASLEHRARKAVARATEAGHLPAEPAGCAVCGTVGYREESAPGQRLPAWSIVWHHHSYAEADWLNVTPVCHSCHHRIHLGQIPEPWTGERRTGADARQPATRKRVPGRGWDGRAAAPVATLPEEDLGAMLRSLRHASGMRAVDIVRELDVPRATLYCWEGEGSRPAPEDLHRLLNLYSVTDAVRLRVWELRCRPKPSRGVP